jgi:predicted CoA-binding protein
MGNSTLSVLVLGASTNPSRYSYKAVLWLSEAGYKVIAVGKTKGKVGKVEIQKDVPEQIENLYAVSVYLNPENQTEYVNQIIKLKPKKVIFNPLAENTPFEDLLTQSAIEPIQACTLVMLKTGEF